MDLHDYLDFLSATDQIPEDDLSRYGEDYTWPPDEQDPIDYDDH